MFQSNASLWHSQYLALIATASHVETEMHLWFLCTSFNTFSKDWHYWGLGTPYGKVCCWKYQHKLSNGYCHCIKMSLYEPCCLLAVHQKWLGFPCTPILCDTEFFIVLWLSSSSASSSRDCSVPGCRCTFLDFTLRRWFQGVIYSALHSALVQCCR